MYILKNAWKSITRNKGRNILLIIIALVIATSACVALSIREAAEKAKAETLGAMSINAQLSYDRSSAMQGITSGNRWSFGSSFNRENYDFSSLRRTPLALDDYLKYAELLSENDGYYYSQIASINASGDLVPYGANDSNSGSGYDFGSLSDRWGGSGNFSYTSADFGITGYSSYDAMLSMFGADGTYTITGGEIFSENSADLACIISDELAMYNGLNVGDKITLANPKNDGETYEFIVSGIYTNSASDNEDSRFTMLDPANNIYMNTAALGAILENSAANNSDNPENVISAATTFTYVLSDLESYEAFKTAAEQQGLPENYAISSTNASAYENSVTPLNTLGEMTGWFFLIVVGVGGVILVVLNIFNLRERKYEIGVLTAIGMKKSKVAVQFVCELFIITFAAITIGAGIGAAVSVPVTNTLLEQQIASVEETNETVNNNFGLSGGQYSGMLGQLADRFNQNNKQEVSYVTSVSSATDLTVILQMVLVGLFLTIISSLAAMVSIMRYEPLRILSDRS